MNKLRTKHINLSHQSVMATRELKANDVRFALCVLSARVGIKVFRSKPAGCIISWSDLHIYTCVDEYVYVCAYVYTPLHIHFNQ